MSLSQALADDLSLPLVDSPARVRRARPPGEPARSWTRRGAHQVEQYDDFRERVKSIPSHRFWPSGGGEQESVLKAKIDNPFARLKQ